MKRFKAQSTLEYVIILAAIIGAIVVVASSILKPSLNRSYTDLTGKMESKVGDVSF